jgi:hypothetical protein
LISALEDAEGMFDYYDEWNETGVL